jgi:cell division transport system permease protein
VVTIVILMLGDPVQRIAGLYGSSFSLHGLDGESSLVLVAGGAALGWLGSFIVATRELRGIEPQ